MRLRDTSFATGIEFMAPSSHADCAQWVSGTSLLHRPRPGRMALPNGQSDQFGASVWIILSSWARNICAVFCEPILVITIKSERIVSQFIVLIGTAYEQGNEGVSIRALADHTQLAATHVTTEVGRLIERSLLTKQASTRDRRSVLVRLSQKGEDAILAVNPLLRRVNDLLFGGISREDFGAVSRFLDKLALNSEYALAEIRRSERERTPLFSARHND